MVRIRDLHKWYGKNQQRQEVLKGIDLEIPSGQMVCLLGPSGSGKSTLLNILGGIECIDQGHVEACGQRLEGLSEKALSQYRRQHVGFVFQFYNLIDHLTVRENIRTGAYLSKDPLVVGVLLDALGLAEQAGKYPNEISGGQAQRTSIGRAMAKKPTLLLCDEPTGALDYESAKGVLALIEDLNANHQTTVIIATHNTQIARMCDMTLKLHDGSLKQVERNQNKLTAKDVRW
ncbi:MAG: ABC transporter ATP-binding protein [Peptococcus niger]|nr:ABC transporter ATP-binding protein [Clostridiales bacterium]